MTPAPRMAQHGLIATLFFASAIASAGMPPLSGFIGKLLILDAVRDMPEVWLIWSVILVTSLVGILGFAQAGSAIFWKTTTPDPIPEDADTDATSVAAPRSPALPLLASFTLLAGIVALSVFAGPVTGYVEATADQIHTPSGYIDAVLGQR